MPSSLPRPHSAPRCRTLWRRACPATRHTTCQGALGSCLTASTSGGRAQMQIMRALMDCSELTCRCADLAFTVATTWPPSSTYPTQAWAGEQVNAAAAVDTALSPVRSNHNLSAAPSGSRPGNSGRVVTHAVSSSEGLGANKFSWGGWRPGAARRNWPVRLKAQSSFRVATDRVRGTGSGSWQNGRGSSAVEGGT